MLDTMTATKVVGAFCGSLLVFLLAGWMAELLYHHNDHGHQEFSYAIDTGEGEAETEVEEGPAFAELLAAADVGKGEGAFRKCAACHKVDDGANGTGPHLYGIVGRATSSATGFEYSGALVAVTDAWTPEALDAFLEKPSSYAPGTKMAFNGISNAEERANLIAWLDSLDD